jgi:YfiR/HmsC-like
MNALLKALKNVPRLALSMIVLAIAIPTALADSQAKVSDQEVKAALLFRVSKFIEWPAAAFSDTKAPFVMCIVGDESRVRAFQALKGKILNGRPVAVRRITGDMLDLGQCHAAFFPDDSDADVDYAFSKLRDAPVLTVGESEAFISRGGTLAFVTRDQRVQFTVHLAASKRAHLSVSSQLLQLATVVGGSTP